MDARLKALKRSTAELGALRGGMLEKKEYETGGLQQKRSDKQDILRDSTSSLDDERPRRKLGESSFIDLAKSVEEENHFGRRAAGRDREAQHSTQFAKQYSAGRDSNRHHLPQPRTIYI